MRHLGGGLFGFVNFGGGLFCLTDFNDGILGLVAFGGIEGRPFNVTSGEPAPLTYDGLFVDNVFMDNGVGTNSRKMSRSRFARTCRC